MIIADFSKKIVVLDSRESVLYGTTRSSPEDLRSNTKVSVHMVIGLSVSSCILDIVRGVVNINDVAKIIGSTCVEDPAKWGELIQLYRRVYWDQYPDQAEKIFHQLLAEGKIFQPRVSHHHRPEFDEGKHWVNSEQEIEYIVDKD